MSVANPCKATDTILTDRDRVQIPFIPWHGPGENREAIAIRVDIHQHCGRPMIRRGQAAAHELVASGSQIGHDHGRVQAL